LTGSLPTELGNLRVLERLIVGDNKLKGTIPNSLQSIANLTEINLCTFERRCFAFLRLPQSDSTRHVLLLQSGMDFTVIFQEA
jgi:hypothetical protein